MRRAYCFRCSFVGQRQQAADFAGNRPPTLIDERVGVKRRMVRVSVAAPTTILPLRQWNPLRKSQTPS